MNNYFTCVGSKAPLRSNRVFSEEDADFKSLHQFYQSLTKPIEANQVKIQFMFHEWLDLLFNENNIVVHGPLSKFELLETFKERCLDSNKIPDFSSTSTLKVTTVRMHGAEPVSLQTFLNALFKLTEDKQIDEEYELKQFVEKIDKIQTHYVFLMHSYDLLYKNCRKACDLIFRLYTLKPKYIHIILSLDHISSPKIIHKLKFQLKLVFYNLPYTESYLYENVKQTGILEQVNVGASLSKGLLDLQSLQDTYQALQSTGKDILVYLIEKHLEKKNRPGREAKLKFSELFEYCESKFICRRAAALRNHLGELIDHRLIELDETGKNIQCLIGEETCRTFLGELKSQAVAEIE